MSQHRRGARPSRPLCSSLAEDDGIDPRLVHRRATVPTADRARDRLCGAAARLIALALADLASDESLPSFHVAAVEPAPDASRLRVRVCPLDPTAPVERLRAWLEAVRAALRAALAAGLARRRAPDVVVAVERREEPA